MQHRIWMALVVLLLSGCAARMAMEKEGAKDLALFRPGVERALIIAEFGKPEISEMRDGGRYEIYRFKQGHHGAWRFGRALVYTAADIATLGIAEVVTSPTEAALDGSDMAFEVYFDDTDRVKQVRLLKSE
jgi:hypothetical protein